MRRREFITLLGGGAAAWPLWARAQQSTLPVVGLIRMSSPGQAQHLKDAFNRGLKEVGFVEDQNVTIESRWAEGVHDRIPTFLADLVGRRVNVIAVPGSTAAALAAKAATQTIPIIFMIGADPEELGLVHSLARPGGNITGVAQLMVPVIAKRLEILHQLVPKAQLIALLINPTNPFGDAERREVHVAARALGLETLVVLAKSEDEIEGAFTTATAQGAGALLIGADAYFFTRNAQIAALAARHRLPAISHYREFTTVEGLMSYGNSLTDAYRLTGVYVGRILKGDKPTDLPVMQPTKFDFMINLKTAKKLGLAVPERLLALADEVIE